MMKFSAKIVSQRFNVLSGVGKTFETSLRTIIENKVNQDLKRQLEIALYTELVNTVKINLGLNIDAELYDKNLRLGFFNNPEHII